MLKTSSALLISSPHQQDPPYRRKRASSVRNQFNLLANRFNKLVSSVSFRIVQRRASFPDSAGRLRLYTPATPANNTRHRATESGTDSMSSRSHSHRRINFNVSEQYEINDIIGEGAYGVVAYVPWHRASFDSLGRRHINLQEQKLRLKRSPLSIIQCSVCVRCEK